MPAPLRISFVVPHDGLSGGIRAIACHARGLAARGHDVVVVCAEARPGRRPLRRRLLGAHREAWQSGGHLSQLEVERRVVAGGRPLTARDLPDADVVVATWWNTAPLVAALPASKGAKAYLVQDFGAHRGQPLDRVAPTWRLPLRKVAVSRWLGELVRAHTGGGPVEVVPLGVDPERFAGPPRSRGAQFTVGLSYATQPHKGLGLMLAAVALAGAGRTLRLVCYGARDPDPALPLPVGSRFLKRPSDHALADAYRSCDAWLFGSSREGFGLPILEAMACRTPVIAVRAGAAPELLRSGGGVLLDTHAAEEMASAIARLAAMPEATWQALSEQAGAVARGYPWARASLALEAALYRAVEAGAHPTPARSP